METTTLIRPDALAAQLGVDKQTLVRLVDSGELAAPIRVGKRAVGYLSGDVDAFIDRRRAERDSASGDADLAVRR